ncbi:hypothetical protein JTE90_024720 [Oedothorax gibbosus]|uniref:MADF domain-containing protein n=1 Tax=Oedothorax gibbosus TaxID=931172 RepID=A0AAV6U8W7_9ARAC|nr:hypothetical protein JTE90_024720 [Oedothorax gibbosus]
MSSLDSSDDSSSSVEPSCKWSNNEVVLQLINAYKNKPILWNPTHPHYNCPQLKKKAWGKLAKNFNVSEKTVQNKMSNLRNTLKQNMIRREDLGPTYKITWFAYKAMLFLEPFMKAVQEVNKKSAFEKRIYNATEANTIKEFPAASTSTAQGEWCYDAK